MIHYVNYFRKSEAAVLLLVVLGFLEEELLSSQMNEMMVVILIVCSHCPHITEKSSLAILPLGLLDEVKDSFR